MTAAKPDFNILAPFGDGWILDHIALAIERSSPLAFNRVQHGKGLTPAAVDALMQPPASLARGTIFMHFGPHRAFLKRSRARQDVVFFTHFYEGPQGDSPEPEILMRTLGQAARLWTMSAYWDRWLVERGYPQAQLRRIMRAVDCDVFHPGARRPARSRPVVGMVSQYHYRKNEAFILRAVRRHPGVDWVLLGRNWEDTPFNLVAEATALGNFRWLNTRETRFEDWPEIYRSFDVFLSPSFCEGGPFPLLESMACGVWPICSRTGFAEDLIATGDSGHVFDVDDDEGFDRCLDEALARISVGDRRADIRAAVSPWSWRRLSESAAADLAQLAAC
jgi:glycosyltransferase involved in cell wall biosynthesis